MWVWGVIVPLVFFLFENAIARKSDSWSAGSDSWQTTLVLQTNTVSFQ